MDLSDLLSIARASGAYLQVNDRLSSEAARFKDSNLGAIIRLWIGDNLRLAGHYRQAIATYIDLAKDYPFAGLLGHPIAPRSLEYVAYCHLQLGDVDEAVRALMDVTRHPNSDTASSLIWYQIGEIFESDRRFEEATVAYSRSVLASDDRPVPSLEWRELSKRAIARLSLSDSLPVFATVDQLVQKLQAAVLAGDSRSIRAIASPIGFFVGGAACDARLVYGDGIIDAIAEDAKRSQVQFESFAMPCCTGKHTIESTGWSGEAIAGSAYFLIEQSGSGWMWTGLSVATPTAKLSHLLRDQTETHPHYGNLPSAISIKAPWPAGSQNFAAGGFGDFLATTIPVFLIGTAAYAAILALVAATAPALAVALTGLIATGATVAEVIVALIVGFGDLANQRNTDLNLLLGLAMGASLVGWIALVPAAFVSPCGFGVRGFYYQSFGHSPANMGLDSTFAIDFTRNVRGVPFLGSAVNELVLAVADGIVSAGGFINPANSTVTNWAEITHVPATHWSVLDTLLRGTNAGAPLAVQLGNANIPVGPVQTAIQTLPGTVSNTVSTDATGIPRRGDRPLTDIDVVNDASNAVFRRTTFGIDEEQRRDNPQPRRRGQGGILPYEPNFGRYSSRYLHMQPTGRVSLFQLIRQGNPIGQIGNTGVSATPHLHFELHDLRLVRPANNPAQDPLGFSIRPSPMDVEEDGSPQLLRDQDNGRCVRSTNRLLATVLRFPGR